MRTDAAEPGFRFVVVADSHIRPSDQEVDAYRSNALLVRRNEHIVDLCNRIDAAFVVHLGDIVHPLPVEDTHRAAIDLAAGIYDRLEAPVYFVAGNHDVGDKPDALVAVPTVVEENYPVFESAWGPSFFSFDHGDGHFVVVDTQVLNSALAREERQRRWIEEDLAGAAGKRIFLFTHYPPFVRSPDENEHYDNIGEPARSWLLGLLTLHDVEAVFSGHVHNFLYNRYRDTDLYVAPSTGFVRPDYAEIAGVPPPEENGREDPPKLGIFVVDVNPGVHVVRPVRSFGSVAGTPPLPVSIETSLDPAWESSVGVSLRHGWATVTDFPTAGLDEFRRKRIRNDGPLLALWEARIRDVRVPVEDVATAGGARRMRELVARGARFTVFSGGVPDARTLETIRSIAADVHRWEIVAPPARFADVVSAVAGDGRPAVEMAIAPIVPVGAPDAVVHHFVAAGFTVGDDPSLDRWLETDTTGIIREFVFRVPWTEPVGNSIGRAGERAAAAGRRAIVIVELPRGSESATFDDDAAVASRVGDVVRAAAGHPDVAVFLDGFMDHDRGYYPRHGLIDRSFNPRPALYRLIEESSGRR